MRIKILLYLGFKGFFKYSGLIMPRVDNLLSFYLFRQGESREL